MPQAICPQPKANLISSLFPDRMSEFMPGRMPEVMPNIESQTYIPNRVPEFVPDRYTMLEHSLV